ncbi:MAG: TetR/AcrR family transcriptional regulator [Bacilli bacterium]|jgi:AcrR family transcriptional regulator|nr:TetR/AcrR family transcriptional regulator [Bacilli bacterium]MCH4235401.1 TetR/AcrR family transcriptional regulator [Bacilli bacterium]
MNKSESKYFNTARFFDEALINILNKKEYQYITVKEICKEAGVNRSTFYLHYETINDLLEETIEYYENKFFSSFQDQQSDFVNQISTIEFAKLDLITPTYLTPYLAYVKENKKLFKAFFGRPKTMNADKSYRQLSEKIFMPILSRFNIPTEKQPFYISYFIHGMMAIVEEWIKEGCMTPIDEVIEVIINCVKHNNDSN